MDPELKGIMKGLSLAFRHLLEGFYEGERWHTGDLERRLNELGIWRDRKPKPIEELPQLSEDDIKARKIVDAYIEYREDSGVKRADAVDELVRESAYTWFNRLFALRCMEARDIVDEVILQKNVYGWRSLQHNRLAQRYPELCTGDDDGLFALLFQEFERRLEELPMVFDPDSPAVALRPSVATIKMCIALLSGRESVNGGYASDAVFKAHDAFGWAYQYWNSEEKDRVFEKVRTKKVKIKEKDIIPVTCIYTEPYMVKFLVQNSLGAQWMGMYPGSKLYEKWEYYVRDADRAPVDNKPIKEITFLDPACGSGHFLLEAFDLFYDMYFEEGEFTEPVDICVSILNNNLYGIDIDERAIQISISVVWMKAKEKAPQIKTSNPLKFHDHFVATNIRLPKGKDHLNEFLIKHQEDKPLRDALESVFNALENVHEIGSLLKIEEPVERELKKIRHRMGVQTTLFGPKTEKSWEAYRDQVMGQLKKHFSEEAVSADLSQAFFGQSANKGLRLIDLLSNKYDVVATNPPYMGSKNIGLISKKYIEDNFTIGKSDLYASFLLRCQELANINGQVAMVTQQSWMFLYYYTKLREFILKNLLISHIAQLGTYAFDEISGEVVNVVLFIIKKIQNIDEHKILALQLISGKNASEKKELLNKAAMGEITNIIFTPLQKNFLLIPQMPICYWLRDKIFQLLSGPTVEKEAYVVAGLQTSNDDHYVRYTWETPISEWNKPRKSRRWLPLEKGGGYKKWFGNHFWTVDWEYNGSRIKTSPKSYVRNEKFYFKEGYTYSGIASGSLGLRLLLPDSIFAVRAASGIFPKNSNKGLLAILNCRFSSYATRAIAQNVQMFEGAILRIPIPRSTLQCLSVFESDAILLKKKLIVNNLLERTFQSENVFAISSSNNYSKILLNEMLDATILHSIEGIIEKIVFSLYNLVDDDLKAIISETGTPSGWHPLIQDFDILPELHTNLPETTQVMLDYLKHHRKLALLRQDIAEIKEHLRIRYMAGPGAKIEDESYFNLENDETVICASLPLPEETFLEELSQKLQIHPISIYWLLREGVEKDGWHCLPEEKRITEDWFTVLILFLLGHRWPKQIEADEPIPDWADPDGIISLTEYADASTLLERIRQRLNKEFEANAPSIERDFEDLMGKNLREWLMYDFFKHHTSQFKKRPIAWQIQSNQTIYGRGRSKRSEPAFSCLIYYQKLDEDTLPKIRSQYVGPLRSRYETELKTLEAIGELDVDQTGRRVRLEGLIEELERFDEALEKVIEEGFDLEMLRNIIKEEPLDDWTSIDGVSQRPSTADDFYMQERAYIPDINDGVRVNIAPIQKAGLLASDVLSSKDVDKAIIDRAEWRVDERRWCREGKLPKPGWWK